MPDPLWVIDATLRAKGFNCFEPPAVYRGPISIHGRKALIEIEIPDLTFALPPRVRLIDHSAFPGIAFAHLVTNNEICYIGQSGLPLNMYDPGGSILRVLIEVTETLQRSFGNRAADEFQTELAAYWQGKGVLVALEPRAISGIGRAELIKNPGKNTAGFVLVPEGAWVTREETTRTSAAVLHFDVPLQHNAFFAPRSLQAAIEYIEAQPRPPAGWRKCVMEATSRSQPIFLLAPNAKLGWSSILPAAIEAISANAKRFRSGFLEEAISRELSNIELERMTGVEADLRFCVERNLTGQSSLIGKRIALIGCGTIGGYLGRLLVQSGAGCGEKLQLYDNDIFSAGNLGRHLLDFSDLGKPKANALADRLRKFHPEVSIDAIQMNALEAWETIRVADLIIDVTGDPNVSTALNDRHHRDPGKRALLYSWVFGNGVAAQSFLDLNDNLACYSCLKTGFDGQWRFNPLKDPNSPLRYAAARCGEAGYVPFSADAPITAAALCNRAAVEWAGGVFDPRLRTSIIDRSAGKQNVGNGSPTPFKGCLGCGR